MLREEDHEMKKLSLTAWAWPWVLTPQFPLILIGLKIIEVADDYVAEMFLRPWTGTPSKTTLHDE